MENKEINEIINLRIEEIRQVIVENLKSLKNQKEFERNMTLRQNEGFTHRIFELKDLNTKLTGREFPSFVEELRKNLTPEIRKRFSESINEILKKG